MLRSLLKFATTTGKPFAYGLGPEHQTGNATMQHRTLRPMDHREAAARFRLLADIEPWANLRQHFRRLAAQYDGAAESQRDQKPVRNRFVA